MTVATSVAKNEFDNTLPEQFGPEIVTSTS